MYTFHNLVQALTAYADTKATIAELRAKNQNAPAHYFDQAHDLLSRATEIACELDKRVENL